MSANPKRLLRLPQVCERTGWSESTVRRKVKEKKLSPPLHLCGDKASTWPEDEIDALVEAAITAREAGADATRPLATHLKQVSPLGVEARQRKRAARRAAEARR